MAALEGSSVVKLSQNSCLCFLRIFFTNLPLLQHFLERWEVATKKRKEVACIVSKPLVSCLWGCGESVNPPKLNIQEVQGALSSRPKGDPGTLPIFQDFLLLSNHTPESCLHNLCHSIKGKIPQIIKPKNYYLQTFILRNYSVWSAFILEKPGNVKWNFYKKLPTNSFVRSQREHFIVMQFPQVSVKN